VFGSKGEPFERRYLDSAPREDTAAAKRIAIVESEPYAKRDAAVIAQLEAMTRMSGSTCWSMVAGKASSGHADAQMAQVEASNQIATIANGINRRAPLPTIHHPAASAVDTPRTTIAGEATTDDVCARARYRPVPIVFTDSAASHASCCVQASSWQRREPICRLGFGDEG